MAVDKLVDSAKLDACCTAEANAIRAKTGGSAQLAFDWANSKGFADAIAAISGGGGASYTLLASGTYTKTADGNSMSIPVSYSGTAKSFFVVAVNGNVNAGTWAWARILDTSDLTGAEFGTLYNYKYGSTGVISGTNNVPSLSSSDISVARYNTSNTIKAQNYNWFIYGEATT